MQDIYDLLSDGERVTLECKKASKGVQILFGTLIPLLPTHTVEPFCWVW